MTPLTSSSPISCVQLCGDSARPPGGGVRGCPHEPSGPQARMKWANSSRAQESCRGRWTLPPALPFPPHQPPARYEQDQPSRLPKPPATCSRPGGITPPAPRRVLFFGHVSDEYAEAEGRAPLWVNGSPRNPKALLISPRPFLPPPQLTQQAWVAPPGPALGSASWVGGRCRASPAATSEATSFPFCSFMPLCLLGQQRSSRFPVWHPMHGDRVQTVTVQTSGQTGVSQGTGRAIVWLLPGPRAERKGPCFRRQRPLPLGRLALAG